MNCRTTICFSAAMAATAGAWAQQGGSPVTIYGLIDEGVEYVRGVAGPNGTTTNDTRVGTGSYPSRLGFRGSEDLGGGLKAVFTLEQGLNPDVGTLGQGSRAWGRQAFVGLSRNPYGALTFGRQYVMRYWATNNADVFGPATQGLGVLDPAIPNGRADNNVAYRGTWGGFTGGVNYSFGRDAVAGNNLFATNCPGETSNSKQCREWSAMAQYEVNGWGGSVAYETQHGGTAATFGGLTSPELTDTRTTVNAYYKKDDIRAAVGWMKRDNEGSATTPKSDLYWVTAAWPVAGTSFVVDGMVAALDYAASDNGALLLTLRGTYHLSRRTALYLSAAQIDNDGTLALAVTSQAPAGAALPGGTQRSLIAGIRHTF